MNKSSLLPIRCQIFQAKFTDRFFGVFKRSVKIGLTAFLAIGFTACEDKGEEARLQAEGEARISAAAAGQLQAEEETRFQAAGEDRQRSLEESRGHRGVEEIRRKVRSAAAGSKMDILKTLDGKKYENVEIREVSDIGISIRHDSGVARLPFEKLPQEMQERFHFDPKEKEMALKHEQKLLAENAKKIDAAQASISDDNKQRQQTLDQNRRKELQAALSIASARVRQVEGELYSIQSELRADLESTRRTSRYYRPRGVSRAPIIRERLEDKQQQLGAARQKEAQLRAALMR